MISYIRNLILIAVGFYVVSFVSTTLLTGTDSATTLFNTIVPTMIVIGGAIYAVIGGIRLTKTGGGGE